MLSIIQILTISVGVLFTLLVVLFFIVFRLQRILYAVRSNVGADIKPTAEQIEYLIEQRDKHHWSHPKYKAYNDRLLTLGVA